MWAYSDKYVEEWSFTTVAYFVSVSITTVGYGDFYPVNRNAKVFTIFYVLFGVIRIMSLLTLLTEGK
jgi:hypothetical protein